MIRGLEPRQGLGANVSAKGFGGGGGYGVLCLGFKAHGKGWLDLLG